MVSSERKPASSWQGRDSREQDRKNSVFTEHKQDTRENTQQYTMSRKTKCVDIPGSGMAGAP